MIAEGNHAVTGRRRKYLWPRDTGTELFFDLAGDPHQCPNLRSYNDKLSPVNIQAMNMTSESNCSSDRAILRDLVRQYVEVAAGPAQNERRRLWSEHNSLKKNPRIPIIAQAGRWSKWCMEYWGDSRMKCQDPFFREYEKQLRIALFNAETGDDSVFEPWLTVVANQPRGWGTLWGVRENEERPEESDGAFRMQAPIREWSDIGKLSPPPHKPDKAQAAKDAQRLEDAVGDLIAINRECGPSCQAFLSDISTNLARLRGLEQVMLDVYESPEELKRLIEFMQKGILANTGAAEADGDYSLTSQHNQEFCYDDGLEWPKANSGPRKRGQLWGYSAAQEFTLISPEMWEEFLFNYQFEILSKYGLVAYGCCDDLTRKIGILGRLKNLRVIAVSPWADIAKCAEQIGTGYVFSWRPNPTDQVCADWDESRIRRKLRDGLAACRGCRVHIHLKDTETLQGEPDRLARWVKIAREVCAEFE
jgi:hypothetical protein